MNRDTVTLSTTVPRSAYLLADAACKRRHTTLAAEMRKTVLDLARGREEKDR